MGGFLGLGHSSEKTDRGAQLGARQGLWNIFSYGLPLGQQQEAVGQQRTGQALSTLNQAKEYWTKLLSAGRTDTAMRAAPAVNAVQDQADAVRRAEATMGTGRGGGTAPLNREAGATTTKSIDDIINSTLVTSRDRAATGLQDVSREQAGIANMTLANAMQLLGFGGGALEDILSNATSSRALSQQINQQTQEQFGQVLGGLMLGLGF